MIITDNQGVVPAWCNYNYKNLFLALIKSKQGFREMARSQFPKNTWFTNYFLIFPQSWDLNINKNKHARNVKHLFKFLFQISFSEKLFQAPVFFKWCFKNDLGIVKKNYIKTAFYQMRLKKLVLMGKFLSRSFPVF